MSLFEMAAQVIPLLFIVLAFNLRAFDALDEGDDQWIRGDSAAFRAFLTTFAIMMLAAAEWVSIDAIATGHDLQISRRFVLNALILGGGIIVTVFATPHTTLLTTQWREGNYPRRAYITFLLAVGLSPLAIAGLLVWGCPERLPC